MGVEHIFRAYDIRGIFNRDLTVDVMARIGMAIAAYAPGEYAVGGDVRGSTPALKSALIGGLLAGGCDVVDIGIVPIGCAMYATLHEGYGMAYVTASHLPPEWNGVKLSRPKADLMVGPDIYAIRDIFMDDSRLARASYDRCGRYRRVDLLPKYVDLLKSKAKESGLKVVVDCGNGAAALVFPKVLRDLGHEVLTINCDIDPRFPARGAEPTPDKLDLLKKSVMEWGADFGVAFDGDGDRTLFVSNEGRVLTAEQAAIVMLEGIEKGDVVANVECSSILESFVADYGGRVYRVPVGRTYMIREVMRTGAVLGVESSGHYVVWRNLNLDDGILTAICFAEAVARLGEKISRILPEPYPVLRTKLPVNDAVKFKLVEALARDLSKKYDRITTIDGVRVDLEDGWVLVRPSNTEPLVRITVEAKTLEKAKRLLSEYVRLVEEYRSRVKA